MDAQRAHNVEPEKRFVVEVEEHDLSVGSIGCASEVSEHGSICHWPSKMSWVSNV